MQIIPSLRIFGLVLVHLCLASGLSAQQQPVDYVNPYIGNISHLLVPTFPTIHLPNSFLRVYPERGDFTGNLLHGLPLVVTSHRGSSAFNLSSFQGNENDLKPVISYSYDQEKLTPYSYSVYLDEQQTEVQFGLSHQSAMYELKFSQNQAAYLILNSQNGSLKWNDDAISGFQTIDGNTRVYIYLKPEQTPESISVLKENELVNEKEASGKNACVVLKFGQGAKTVRLRYGISFIDTDQAHKNLNREIPDYDLKSLQESGRKIWNESLGKIEVTGGTDNEKTIFYTSFYRTFERPVCISEDGRYYSAFDGTVHNDNGTPFFTDDWIWDSYRAHHPLRVLVDPKKEEQILHSFVEMAGQMKHNWWPTFPEITGDSRRMNSNHGVASVIDAYRKGLRGFDLEKAYEACKGAITEKTLAPWSGMPAGELDQFYKEHGYIPALHEGEKETIPEVNSFEKRQPVAVTLGTSYDEWCLGQLAGELGKKDDAAYFGKASFNYRNLFNTETKFFHPKDKYGKFIEPFDYRFSGGIGARESYGENNGWTYRWDVQHNIPDLIDLMGGKSEFANNLDALFSTPMGRGKREFYTQLPDQTGNVGQFTMANEPSLHIPYLYNYAGQPWKTQKVIRMLLHEWFRNDLMGVPGDEDGGGMTSFVVFSYMGFYPVTPGMPIYSIGSPIFTNVKIHLDNGKIFEIEANNASAENKYIQSATLNGTTWDKPWFSHKDLANGGKLILQMGPKANRSWGSSADNAPLSETGSN
ncbi:alpha-1,2-mannosidase [Aquipluma nitroreducens]|uniref:Alpha-1,2-mannosidase n=2 Tax=Aquipluma nitroreducens TaxID=2010828 RepID=A0A5K7S736_9BACT|nr:alpha-1,2-mannosidase [Aquipluma nitroreducens]